MNGGAVIRSRTLVASLLAAPLLAACGSSGTDEPAVPACDPEKSGTICTIVGDGTRGYGGDEGPALQAHIDTPQDLVVMPDGELWLLDFNNYLIRAVDDDGQIRTVVGTGLLGDSPPPEEISIDALEAKFNHTTDLFVHDGYLYLAAWHNSRIKRVNLAEMTLENFAGIGKRMLYTGNEGPALEAAVDLPSSIAVDAEGNIAIMDQANQVVRSVDTEGNIHCLAGTCVVEAAGTSCEPGQVPTPCPNSNKTTCGDPELTCDLPCTPGYGGDGEDALLARLAQPFGQMADPAGRIAFDPDGNLILADSNNNRIRRVDGDGVITTIAGTGDAGASGDGSDAVDAKLNNPVDVEVAADGTIYFTDTYNSCIRKIDTDGIIDTVAGHCGVGSASRGFKGDGGPPKDALLARPYGIELDGERLYIADSYNHRIRVVNLD